MSSDVSRIEIAVAIEPAPGRPGGYRFAYASSDPRVDGTGNIDLRDMDKDDVELRFNLSGGEFEASEPVWFEAFPDDGRQDPFPCPTGVGNHSTFKQIDRLDGTTLQFVDKNKDHKRYAYALRCRVDGTPVMDDPMIINR